MSYYCTDCAWENLGGVGMRGVGLLASFRNLTAGIRARSCTGLKFVRARERAEWQQ